MRAHALLHEPQGVRSDQDVARLGVGVAECENVGHAVKAVVE